MGYDWGLTTQFSANGHINQIEFALEAVKKGLTVVAIKGEHCLAIGVERRAIAKLQIPATIRKIYQVDAHVVGVGAGLSADMRVLVDKVRIEALSYRMNFEDCPTVEYLSRFAGDVMLESTISGNSRPFGCSMLMTGMDLLANTTSRQNAKPYPVPRIFLCEPSGNIREWKAVAIGRNAPTVNEYLEKNYDVNAEYLANQTDAQAQERILCEFVLAAMMEVTGVSCETVELATMNAERGVRLLQDNELNVMVENLFKQNAELKEKVASAAFRERLKGLEVRDAEAFHPQAAD